jgi:hypothetical protein
LTAEILIFFSNIVLKCKHLLDSQFKGKRRNVVGGLIPPSPSFADGGQSQRKGMGQLEYQSMPSLRGVAHDGWFCVFIIFKKAGKPISSQLSSSCQGNWYSTVKADGTARPSMPGHSPPASQASRRVGPAL